MRSQFLRMCKHQKSSHWNPITQSKLSDIWHDFRLPPRCKWRLRRAGNLRSVDWKLVAAVSGYPSGPSSRFKHLFGTAWPMKMEVGCPETPITNLSGFFFTLYKFRSWAKLLVPKCNIKIYSLNFPYTHP